MAERSIERAILHDTRGELRARTRTKPGALHSLSSLLLVLERIESAHIQLLEIAFIPGRNDQAMDSSSCGNHCVLQQVGRLIIHNSGPFTETWNIHGQDLVGRR